MAHVLATRSTQNRELNTTLGVVLAPTECAETPTDDDRKVEAAIHVAGRRVWLAELSLALGWRRTRTQAAIAALERRLDGSGTFLQRSGAAYAFGPRDGVLTRADQQSLGRVKRARSELDIGEARVLRGVITGGIDDHHLQHKLGGSKPSPWCRIAV